MRVINLAKAACKDDHPPLPQRGDRQPKHSGLPYRFFFTQASTRSSAFSMFSIELATLKRKITFTEVAERGAGQSSDTCVFEERVGQFLRRPPGLRDVWENVERAVWAIDRRNL